MQDSRLASQTYCKNMTHHIDRHDTHMDQKFVSKHLRIVCGHIVIDARHAQTHKFLCLSLSLSLSLSLTHTHTHTHTYTYMPAHVPTQTYTYTLLAKYEIFLTILLLCFPLIDSKVYLWELQMQSYSLHMCKNTLTDTDTEHMS